MRREHFPSLVDQYMSKLEPKDREEIRDMALFILKYKPDMHEASVRDAWIEAVIQILIKKGEL